MQKTPMDLSLPGIVVTGASGFVGRHFLEAINGRYRMFCLARRSQFEAGIPRMENQRWTQVDIAHRDALLSVAQCINDHGGADYLIHLAGYYDFTYDEHPEYTRTNVHGTRNVLELAAALHVKRVIFSSSLAACRFPEDGVDITEDTPPDADFPYARSKKAAEELLRDFDAPFARTILRFAAIYSDWCEYPPVYSFLKTWLSPIWNARMLGGKGKSAVPYLHIRDLITLLIRVIERSDALPAFAIYNASPSHTTSHKDLYCAATGILYGKQCRAIHIPRLLAQPAVAVRQVVLDLLGHPPFERTWMMRYIDKDLRVDASRTHAELGWQPTPRYDLKRRTLILIENMKSYPEVWRQRNEAAFIHVARRPNFVMSSYLRLERDAIVAEVVANIRTVQRYGNYRDYERMTDETLRAYVTLFFEVLVAAIRTRDRRPVRTYARLLAFHRRRQGFALEHVGAAVEAFRPIMRQHLQKQEEGVIQTDHLHECIDLNLQLALDEIEEVYEDAVQRERENGGGVEDVNIFSDSLEMIRLVDELHDICRDTADLSTLFLHAEEDSDVTLPAD